MERKFILLVSLAFLNLSVMSQKPVTLQEYPWRMETVDDDVFVFNELHPSIPKGIIYDGDSAAFVPVRFAKQGEGIGKIDRNGAVIWQLHLKGSVVATSKQGSNLIAFFKSGTDDFFNTLTAYLIDPQSGRKIKEKQIFQENSEYWPHFKVLNTPDGEFSCVLVRVTPYEGKRSFQWNKNRRLFQTTDKLNFIYLNENLVISKTLEKNDFLKNVDFRGCIANDKHEVFILSHKEDKFTVQKINENGEMIGKLETTVKTADDRYNMNLAIAVDQQNSDGIFVALSSYEHGDRTLYNYLFDFQRKAVVGSTPVVMDKAYKKGLQTSTTENVAKTNIPFDDMKPVAVLQTANQFIVLKDISDMQETSKGPVNTAHMIVVSFYNRNLQLQSELAIDKAFEFYWDAGCSFGYHLKDQILYLLAAANTGRETYTNLRAVIDCSRRQINSLIEFPSVGDSRRKFIEGAYTLWFSNQYIVSQLVSDGLIDQVANTVLETHQY
jgi:hypothetical protein